MKFNDAWEKIYDTIPEEARLRSDDPDSIKSAKIMAIIWSMLAVSENRLDDICYIDNYKNIVSVELQKEPQKDTESVDDEPKKKKGRPSKSNKNDANTGNEGKTVDATEEQPEEPTEDVT